MQSYYCQCRRCQSYGSMPPAACWECPDCHTHPTLQGIGHPAKARPHNWQKEKVETDCGNGYLTYCLYCGKSKKEIENGEARVKV